MAEPVIAAREAGGRPARQHMLAQTVLARLPGIWNLLSPHAPPGASLLVSTCSHRLYPSAKAPADGAGRAHFGMGPRSVSRNGKRAGHTTYRRTRSRRSACSSAHARTDCTHQQKLPRTAQEGRTLAWGPAPYPAMESGQATPHLPGKIRMILRKAGRFYLLFHVRKIPAAAAIRRIGAALTNSHSNA